MSEIINTKKTINFGNNVWSTSEVFDTYPWAFIGVEAGTQNEPVVFTGEEGGIDSYTNLFKDNYNGNDNYSYAITVGDMKARGDREEPIAGYLKIEGGKYFAGGTCCIYLPKGHVEITGGTFFCQPDSSQLAKSESEIAKYGKYRNFLLNCYDSSYPASAQIVVKGGTFIGFDPSECYVETGSQPTNFVPEGYEVIEDGTYTYTIKDVNREDNGFNVTVPVYKVVEKNVE